MSLPVHRPHLTFCLAWRCWFLKLRRFGSWSLFQEIKLIYCFKSSTIRGSLFPQLLIDRMSEEIKYRDGGEEIAGTRPCQMICKFRFNSYISTGIINTPSGELLVAWKERMEKRGTYRDRDINRKR